MLKFLLSMAQRLMQKLSAAAFVFLTTTTGARLLLGNLHGDCWV
ncbi:hypothetical protein ENHYDAX1_240120 [Enhydrobacter sp. AX1]|nr:hypothetical protein ENHYDAX1_240120 [Enhydrobacter sp. AX1]